MALPMLCLCFVPYAMSVGTSMMSMVITNPNALSSMFRVFSTDENCFICNAFAITPQHLAICYHAIFDCWYDYNNKEIDRVEVLKLNSQQRASIKTCHYRRVNVFVVSATGEKYKTMLRGASRKFDAAVLLLVKPDRHKIKPVQLYNADITVNSNIALNYFDPVLDKGNQEMIGEFSTEYASTQSPFPSPIAHRGVILHQLSPFFFGEYIAPAGSSSSPVCIIPPAINYSPLLEFPVIGMHLATHWQHDEDKVLYAIHASPSASGDIDDLDDGSEEEGGDPTLPSSSSEFSSSRSRASSEEYQPSSYLQNTTVKTQILDISFFFIKFRNALKKYLPISIPRENAVKNGMAAYKPRLQQTFRQSSLYG